MNYILFNGVIFAGLNSLIALLQHSWFAVAGWITAFIWGLGWWSEKVNKDKIRP